MQACVMYGIMMTLLINDGVVRLRELAEKYEVSQRTVVRYIDALAESGIPIISLRGKNGGYTISDSYKLEQSFFTEDEYDRAITCLMATKATFADKLNQQIADKLTHLSRSKKSERQYLLKSDTLIIDSGAWNSPADFRGQIETINKAIQNKKSLWMIYIDRSDSMSERLFDPYTLILKEGIWYVYGWCDARKDFRLFRLSRIKSMRATDLDYIRKESDVYAKLTGNFEDVEKENIEIEFDESVLPEIEEWLGTSCVENVGERKYRAKASVYGRKLLTRKLTGFGSAVKVIAPESLVESVKEECKAIAKQYE